VLPPPVSGRPAGSTVADARAFLAGGVVAGRVVAGGGGAGRVVVGGGVVGGVADGVVGPTVAGAVLAGPPPTGGVAGSSRITRQYPRPSKSRSRITASNTHLRTRVVSEVGRRRPGE
jgi:hypothetical protein